HAEHDRDGRGHRLGRYCPRSALRRGDNGDATAHEFGCQFGQPVEVAAREAIFELDLPLAKTHLAQALAKGRQLYRAGLRQAGIEHADHWFLLCPRRARPRRCTAEKGDKLASFHSMRPAIVWNENRPKRCWSVFEL